MDTKLEVIIIPVSDVDRSLDFYTKLGWRLDADFTVGDLRIVQTTPPGSGASVSFGTNITTAKPGSADGMMLVADDIDAVRSQLIQGGADVSEVFHDEGGVFHHAATASASPAPARITPATARSSPSTIRTATPGTSKRSPPGCPAGSTRPRPRSPRPTTWPVPFAARRPPTASTRPAPASRTKTGPTGTPTIWSANRRGFCCQFEALTDTEGTGCPVPSVSPRSVTRDGGLALRIIIVSRSGGPGAVQVRSPGIASPGESGDVVTSGVCGTMLADDYRRQ